MTDLEKAVAELESQPTQMSDVWKAQAIEELKRLAAKREALQADPFDPRTEMSKDGKRIVLNLWIILVVIPFVCFFIYGVTTAR